MNKRIPLNILAAMDSHSNWIDKMVERQELIIKAYNNALSRMSFAENSYDRAKVYDDLSNKLREIYDKQGDKET